MTQQLAADDTNAPLRITSAEVLGAVGSTNQKAAAVVLEQKGKLMSQDAGSNRLHVSYTTLLGNPCQQLAIDRLPLRTLFNLLFDKRKHDYVLEHQQSISDNSGYMHSFTGNLP